MGTQKIAKYSLFQCSEFKGENRRPNQPKTISFRPHSRSTLANPNTTGLTKDHFFFGDYYSRRAKSAQKLLVFKNIKNRSSLFALILPFENGVLQSKNKKNRIQSVRLSGTFRKFSHLGFVFQNCPLFGQRKCGTLIDTLLSVYSDCLKIFVVGQARSQKFAMGGATLGVWGRSPQRSKILHFFAKIT